MREIKFRAWDKKKNTMNYQKSDHPTFGNHCFDFGDLFYYAKDSLIPMQYTGLKDKNGKEIYEGDILKYYGKYEENHNNYIIKWLCRDTECGFECIEINGDNSMLPSVWTNNMEVIGNIYSNPELLNKEKKI